MSQTPLALLRYSYIKISVLGKKKKKRLGGFEVIISKSLIYI